MSVISKNKSKNLIISLFVPVTTLIILLIFFKPYYMTNDDASIQDALCGSLTGTPYPYHQFINVFLGYFISFLFNFFPSVPWWFIIEIIFLLLGTFMFYYSLLSISYFQKKSIYLSLIFLFVFNFLYFSFNILSISFMVAPAIFASGTISLLFIPHNKNEIKILKPLLVGFSILLVSFMRRETAYIMLCFYTLGLFYYFFSGIKIINKHSLKKILLVFFYLFITTSFILFSNKVSKTIQNHHNSTEFNNFNLLRVKFTDYPHLEYDDNPEYFQALGFSREKYYLAKNWCFLDSEVNEDFFTKVINAPSSNIKYQNTQIDEYNKIISYQQNTRLNKILRPFKILFGNYQKLFFFFTIILTLIQLILLILKPKFNNINYLTSLFLILGTWILIAFIQIQGRTVIRAFLVCTIPMFCISTCLLITNLKQIDSRPLLLSLILFFIPLSLGATYFGIKNSINETYNMNAVSSFCEYAKTKPDDLFIYDYSFSSVMPFYHMPPNIIGWGGSLWKSEFDNLRFSLFLDSKIDINILKHKNIHFVTKDESNFNNLYIVLKQEYSCKSYSIISAKKEWDGIIIYDFIY